MKRVLVYGDSNTRGDYFVAPADLIKQWPYEQQWPNILQKLLGEEWKVIQNGLGGRCAGALDFEEYRKRFDGQRNWDTVLHGEWPLDVVVIALGLNDLYKFYNRKPAQIVDDLLWYESEMAEEIRLHPRRLGMNMPQFVYVTIPKFHEVQKKERNVEDREKVNELLKARAKNVVIVEDIDVSDDGVHFSPRGHEEMAAAVFDKIKEMEGAK